jgi:hypothetical protein
MAAEGSAGFIHQLIDRVVAEYGGDAYRDDIAQAREDYFNQAGKVFEDDAELFEGRMASFLEWYVIERPLQGGAPPMMRALEQANAAGEPEATRRSLAAIATSHRSLFDVVTVEGDTVQLEDVLGGARFKVAERRSTIGFEVGDLVEARVVWDGQRVVFSKTVLFHPRDARVEALAFIDAALAKGTSRAEIIFQLSRMHVRWHRHGHVNAARVYRGGA